MDNNDLVYEVFDEDDLVAVSLDESPFCCCGVECKADEHGHAYCPACRLKYTETIQ